MAPAQSLRTGIYRGVLHLNAGKNAELPFNFEVKTEKKKPVIYILNAAERIRADDIEQHKDSFLIRMPVFDTEFRVKLSPEGLEGEWINHYRNSLNRIPFTARFGESRRFLVDTRPAPIDAEGRWETTFSPGTPRAGKAIGVFHHVERTNLVHGTFLTETGDYRYLDGYCEHGRLALSAFDGSHAYLFEAKVEGDRILEGRFYSGMHSEENWEARRNSDYKLPDADTLVKLLDGKKSLQFRFADTEGRMVSLQDPEFRNRPVLVQIMGSWCPNCWDESRYLAEIHSKYRSQGLAMVALAFEKTEDRETALQQLRRYRKKLGIGYPILYTGKSGKDQAAEIVPVIERVAAFPTLLFLNRQHEVVRVHSGFSGPATGEVYLRFAEETEQFIQNLLSR